MAPKPDPCPILAVVQTPAELRWACQEAAAAAPPRSFLIFRLGDAALHPIPSSLEGGSCRFASVEDLGLDPSAVWRQSRDTLPRLWNIGPRPPSGLLHLASIRAVGEGILRLAYLNEVAARILEHAAPCEVRIPDPGISKDLSQAPQASPNLQPVIRLAAARAGIPCRTPFWFDVRTSLGCLPPRLAQAARLAYLLAYDLARILTWGWRRTKSALTPHSHGSQAPTVEPGGIILANADWELRRHFNLEALSPELAARTFVWTTTPPRLTPFNDPEWRKRADANDLKRLQEGWGDFLCADDRLGRDEPFPTLAAPLILANSRVWYNSATPVPAGASCAGPVLNLLASPILAPERLINWRAMAYAARCFAQASDLFRRFRPALVVVSDSHIGHRAVALAARQHGVVSVMIPQGVVMFSEGHGGAVCPADISCLFKETHCFLADEDYPGMPSRRIICHDHGLGEASPPEDGLRQPSSVRPRLAIVTSRYMHDWTEGMLVSQEAYEPKLRSLVEQLAVLKSRPEIVFKPHPTQEPHGLYHRLQREYPDVVSRVWTEPWLATHGGAPADAVVFFNCQSTIFYYALRQRLPVLAHRGALTDLGRRIYATAELEGSDDASVLAGMIDCILLDPEGPAARQALAQALRVGAKYVSPPAGGISEALAEGLGQVSPSA